MSEKYKYLVTLRPGVSGGYERFVVTVVVNGPQPLDALKKAITHFNKEETQVWQSDDVALRVERVQ